MLISSLCQGSLRLPPPQAQWLARSTHRTQYVYYSEKIQSKVSQGKRHIAKSRRHQAQASQSPLHWSHTRHTSFPQQCRILTGGILCLAGTNFLDAQEGKPVFSINHFDWANKSREPLISVLRIAGPLQKSRLPNTSQGPIGQAGFPKDSRLKPAVLSLFCTTR